MLAVILKQISYGKSGPRGYQNGAEIDAKSQSKSLLKQVSKKIMEFKKKHVFLTCRNMQFRCKNYGFEGPTG